MERFPIIVEQDAIQGQLGADVGLQPANQDLVAGGNAILLATAHDHSHDGVFAFGHDRRLYHRFRPRPSNPEAVPDRKPRAAPAAYRESIAAEIIPKPRLIQAKGTTTPE